MRHTKSILHTTSTHYSTGGIVSADLGRATKDQFCRAIREHLGDEAAKRFAKAPDPLAPPPLRLMFLGVPWLSRFSFRRPGERLDQIAAVAEIAAGAAADELSDLLFDALSEESGSYPEYGLVPGDASATRQQWWLDGVTLQLISSRTEFPVILFARYGA